MRPLIIGGGWSGLAAAVRLAEAGHNPIVFDAAKQLGGRARTVKWQDRELDNGQHLMIGAYQNMLDLLKRIDIEENSVFQRRPLDLKIIDPDFPPLHLSAHPSLPWQIALLPKLCSSLGWQDLLRFLRIAVQIKSASYSENITVQQWCQQTNQSSRLVTQLWMPLCLAIMNTPIEQASASVFASTLRDSLLAKRHSADLLIPNKPLGDLIPQPARHFIEEHGGEVRLQNRIEKIVIESGKVLGVVTSHHEFIATNNLIVAVSPHMLYKLLGEELTLPKVIDYPISTIYLQYSPNFRLGTPIIGLSNSLPQWVLDRSNQSPGLIAVVISGPGEHESLTKMQLTEQVLIELTKLLPELPANYQTAHVIREKRATFCCGVVENKQRPSCKTTIDGLWIAGDYAENRYPATLESAVINGYRAAESILMGNLP
ncbi:hydroxysqualene dehydroxylase HpnE [Methylophaga pinxianii]|uniref:hydroxysqualene dehydroxylase HpnE n=1 Tax=Methylophaga pinxianii TaxID=2881052 RepID=UPI001CF4B402|nr:hydroxysqualene dehydroxylase HpnE [Methylophaga pinxianii]MCB2426376.1 hydroxysqualene dehydroxylase HpnE [Methylophaga pinxianii]UPH45746.1 hydroxysqualene dehydroxylase HpnE [Methylophaga pinxianii]